ncbi:HNH endonuclease signature motif containing protein [Aureliella helgolandensis]|uniref:Putative HNH nuclease YajD n=1 Tax=Aureliella helgolandensis TaxID=2527968 RepID=A0A518G745_9BACT|nr:HNH endonuclease signature motif containing protein [Aureliella helgolandensis]QDV24403.1 HNH endonuclease [Aureliella helgolandensis]
MAERAKRFDRRKQRGSNPANRLAAGRPNSTQRGYDRRWRVARRRFLSDNPACRQCEKRGRIIAATIIDHIIPHRGDKALFWRQSNWQPLCKRCHDQKTAAGQ